MEMVCGSFPMRRGNYYKPNMWNNNFYSPSRKPNYKPTISKFNQLQVRAATLDSSCTDHYISSYDYPHSLTTKYIEEKYQREVETLKEGVCAVLSGLKDPIHKLELINWINKLALSHYFEEEIRESVHQLACTNGISSSIDDDPYNTALCFRVLRQRGYLAPQDIKGSMELYEEVQLNSEGEHILVDEAANFIKESLLILGNNCSDVPKSIKNLIEKKFLQDLGGMKQCVKMLTYLVIMDVHKRQSVYHEEVLQYLKWLNELGLAKNLKLARSQPLKWFAASMGMLFDDVSMSAERVELAKAISFLYVIDDIYDLYGTLDELIIFTEAINKWDYAAIDTLPDYMKLCYKSLLDTINEIAQMINRNHGCNPIDSLKTTWGNLCSAYLLEAKWYASGEVPTAQVYLENGKVSVGAHVALVHVFFLLGLGDGSAYSENEFTSELISSVATIFRLSDDLNGEQQCGEDGTYIECYMKEHPGISVDQARKHAIDMIASEWTSLKKACSCLYHIPTSLKTASLNFARMVDLLYSYQYHDNQESTALEEYVKFMLSKEMTGKVFNSTTS